MRDEEQVNIQVGTKRYMSPEVLERTLRADVFDNFKCADMYSWALVLWEIAHRVQDFGDMTLRPNTAGGMAGASSGGSSGLGTSLEWPSLTSTSPSPWPPNAAVGGGSSGLGTGTTISAHPYQTPFEEHGLPLSTDPSIERMKELVCDQGVRPNIPREWIDDKSSPPWLRELTRIMQTCWAHSASSRLTALRVKKDLQKCIAQLQPTKMSQQHSAASPPRPLQQKSPVALLHKKSSQIHTDTTV